VFTSGEVPYVVTNDGEQSRKALEVYLASLRAAEQEGRREAKSYVLELGTGSGLFAKLFLDQLKARSLAAGNDDYQRTLYIASDNSPGLLNDTRVSGVFGEHEERIVRLNLPSQGLKEALSELLPDAVGALRAVHANYLLDSLPFTILSVCEGGVFELRLKTFLQQELLKRDTKPPALADLDSLDRWLTEQAGTGNSGHDGFLFDSEYVPVARAELPYAELIPDYDPGRPNQQLVHSFGAIACLDEITELIRRDGYFIAMDYGYHGAQAEPLEFQCFNTSVAAGVNFAQLVARCQGRAGLLARSPSSDPASLQARFFGAERVAAQAVQCFQSLYDQESWERSEAPYREAMALVQRGQYEAARWRFDLAQRLQPYNWSLMEAIVSFLTYTLREHAAGLEVAKRALQLNHLSPRLWNLLGDCYYGLGSLESAEQAYQQAARVNPSDVRARANLSYVFLKRGAWSDTLRMVGEALALDRAGDFREELLAKQTEALQLASASHLRAASNGLLRLSGHHALPDRPRS
jgi:tetratricopeptide (TPR) repeat protein